MFAPVDTKDPTAVQAEAHAAYLSMFPSADRDFVAQAFDWVTQCFTGKYADFQPIDARYHDFEHTMQGTLCMVHLLRSRHKAGAQPVLTPRMFELGLIAILLHDTGYLKKRGDHEGTGAKFTTTHVNRSAEFAEKLLGEKNFSPTEIHAVQNMICCTGVDAVLEKIPFQTETEKIVGFALGTADLLGQMAADDYVDKLPILFEEFAEAAKYAPKGSSISNFSSALDLMQKTPAFWEKYVKLKLERDFGGVYKFLNEPYPDGPNEYVQWIEGNMVKLREKLAITAK